MSFFKQISLYIFSGVLLGVGFMYPTVWFLGLAGAGVLLYSIVTYPKCAYIGGYYAWFIKFLFVLSFYWTVYPIDWLPFDFGEKEILLVGLYWLTVSLFLGTGGLVFAFLYSRIRSILSHTQWLGFVLVPIVWVLSEVAGSFLLSIFTLGPGGFINGYFSLGYIGLLLAEHVFLLHVAAILGVYGLSFLAVLLVFLCGQLVQRKKYLLALILIGALIGTAYVPFSSTRESLDEVQVAVINTEFPVGIGFSDVDTQEKKRAQATALQAALATDADYILTPEAQSFLEQENITKALAEFNFFAGDSDAIVIDSGRVRNESGATLQGIVYEPVTRQYVIAHKKYLVPQGEYVPYFYAQLFRAIGADFIIDELESTLAYQVGEETSQASFLDHYPGMLFCFESTNGLGVRQLVSDRPSVPFIAHPISHIWFNEPRALWTQTTAALRVQSVWNNIAIVSANNFGPSQLFTPDGQVITPEIVAAADMWEVGLYTVPTY